MRWELKLWLQLELNSACLELQLTRTVCGTWLYNRLTPTCFLYASHVHQIQPVHRSTWYSNIFDRMHMFLDWWLGRRSVCYSGREFANGPGLKKWYLIPPCLTLSIIRYVSRVKWSNPGKGVVPSPTPRYSSTLFLYFFPFFIPQYILFFNSNFIFPFLLVFHSILILLSSWLYIWSLF